MATVSGTATGHEDLLAVIKTFLEVTLPVAERWVVERNITVSPDKETIWRAPGLSATESLYFGIKTYENIASDYYNFKIGGFTGYVPGNDFESQAGSSAIMGVPLSNLNIPYWITGDGQHVIVFANVKGNYNSFVLGKYLPYATPSRYPYPICVGGMLPTDSATRYDETTYSSWFKGNNGNMQLRAVDGTWQSPDIYPYASTVEIRNTITLSATAVGYYGLHPLIMSKDTPDIYGELDDVYFISGFNNAVENTLVIDAVNFIVFRDVWRTGFMDYIALRLL